MYMLCTIWIMIGNGRQNVLLTELLGALVGCLLSFILSVRLGGTFLHAISTKKHPTRRARIQGLQM